MHNLTRFVLWVSLVSVALVFTRMSFSQGNGNGQVPGNGYVYVNDGGQIRTIGTFTIDTSNNIYEFDADNYSQAYEILNDAIQSGYPTNVIVPSGSCYDRFNQPCEMQN